MSFLEEVRYFPQCISLGKSLIIILLLSLMTASFCEDISNNQDCGFVTTVIRQLENDGFHREVHSLVEMVGHHGVVQVQHCSLVARERLPSGLFVSPDQLEDLGRLGQVQACADGPVDVEAPEPLSTNLTVLVYSGLARAENLLSAQLVLPVHARYHAPSDHGGYRPILLPAPDLFLRCAGPLQCSGLSEVSLPCYACSQEMCHWIQIPYKTNTESLTMLVPVGNLHHYSVVTVLTFTITAGGALYIFSVLANSAANVM